VPLLHNADGALRGAQGEVGGVLEEQGQIIVTIHQ
jgi:hypothetical protein